MEKLNKKLIVIGGGFAGSYCAKKLEDYFQVTLIDNKDYFEFTPSVLKVIVEPENIGKIHALHKDYLKKAIFVNADVKKITKDKVFANNQSYSYDYLVICSGSKYNLPIKQANTIIVDRAEKLRSYAERLKKSKSVLVIGGGIVGVELAAEIIEKYPQKKLTIAHSKEHLMERCSKKVQVYAEFFFRERKVNLLLNEKAMPVKGGFVTDKGTKIKPDLAFLCTGIVPNYEFLNGYLSSSLDERDFLKVNDFLQVIGHTNIFAAGDITNIPEEKTAQNAEHQAKVIVENLVHLHSKPNSTNLLVKYVSKPRPMIISLGKNDGIFYFGNMVLTGKKTALMKQFVEWKTMAGYK